MADLELSSVAALFADRSRAAMLAALMDGRDHAAGELAHAAGVRPQTASAHLARMVDGGLLTVASVGRERRFRLTGIHVAEAIEALWALAPESPPRGLRDVSRRAALRRARTCYDHAASLLERRWLERRRDCRALRITPAGERALDDLGWLPAAVRR